MPPSLRFVHTHPLTPAYIVFYVHHLFVRNWGFKEPFLETNYYCFYPIFDAVASSTVQGFFTYRCWRLLERKWWIVAILVVSLHPVRTLTPVPHRFEVRLLHHHS